jgi:hypothetical protein
MKPRHDNAAALAGARRRGDSRQNRRTDNTPFAATPQSGATKRCAVVIQKPTGTRICFSTHYTQREAELACDQLRAVFPNVAVETKPIRAGTLSPGMTVSQ